MHFLVFLPLFLASAAPHPPAPTAPVDAPVRITVDDLDRVVQPGSLHPRLANLAPRGLAPPDLPMEQMLLVLKLAPEAQARLDRLLRDQQDPASPRYHQWLTPDDFGRQFGAGQAQLDAASGWLAGQGFTVHRASRGRLSIAFSGTAAQVGKAFRTAIAEYEVDGVARHGNATPVSIPAGLASFAAGVASLHDLPLAAHHRPALPAATLNLGAPTFNYLDPASFAAIYDLGPLYQGTTPLTGAGVAIAVVGRCDIDTADHDLFVGTFNLQSYGGSLQVIHPGAAPGILNADEEAEADLDTQWTTAAAPGAAIQFVVCPSTFATEGVLQAALYAVDNEAAPVLSMSFGECEQDLGAAADTLMLQLWAQAASEGMSVFVSTGDNGPAGCDDPASARGTVRAVSGLASTPYDTAVGGTEFNEGSGSYWSVASGSPALPLALGYIPEQPWDESGAVPGGSGLWAGSGGASTLYARPAWQDVAGVPAGNARYVPDVALNAAAGHDPYIFVQRGQAAWAGGTSFAAPAMAGIMALVVQRYGPQGNANLDFYRLAGAQFQGGASAPAVMHDVTSGNTNVPGVLGFTAGTGYDEATGLGSVDAAALVRNWVPAADPITVTLAAQAATVPSGSPVAFGGSAQDAAAGAALAYTWSFGDGSPGQSGASASHSYLLQGLASHVFLATLTVSDGTNVQASTERVTVTPAGVSAAIALPVTSVEVLPGATVTFSADTAATVTQNAGAAISAYRWDFGDGITATGAAATHAFAANANPYTVTLTATDSTGASGQASLSLGAFASVMDVNGDGVVDVRDLLAICAAWNPSLQATSSQFYGLDFNADLDGAGRVDDTDINLWIQNFTPGSNP